MEKQVTLLLVEDWVPTMAPLRDIISRAGFRVLKASSVSEARRAVAAERPDLIIVDVQFPDGSGLDVVREILRTASKHDIPVIAKSGMQPVKLRRQALAAGCSDTLPNPFRLEDLASRIGHWIDRPHARVPAAERKAG